MPKGLDPALERLLGQTASVVMPLVELGAIGFASYVLVYPVCIQYLSDRRHLTVPLITVYAILLLVLLVTWLRLLQVIWQNPGYVPLGDPRADKMAVSTAAIDRYDAYISDYQGAPLWCDKCHNWKPDRAHHCRELNRCVRRMDHYCPWAGGIIGETTHKFFIQFTFYALLYTTFTMIVLAYFFAERSKLTAEKPATWIAALALAATFFVFATTMFFMTSWNQTLNYTSVEQLNVDGVCNIAMLAAPSRAPSQSSPDSSIGNTAEKSDDGPNVLRTVGRGPSHTYVVMQTEPGCHPWDMGSMANWKTIMGDQVIDWFVPLKMSPCLKRSRHGEHPWGGEVVDMARRYQAKTGTRLRLLEER